MMHLVKWAEYCWAKKKTGWRVLGEVIWLPVRIRAWQIERRIAKTGKKCQ
ncbi:MAG: hypothetical protein ACI4DV_05760 [Lachnospiraceae bacterium]